MDFWVRAAQLILSLSILIVLHEFGHFLPARWFKTRVEKFYLFFNPYFSLFKRKIGDTEWGIGWLPLGGYVKIAGMIDESMDKEQLAQPAQPWEFRSKPAWQRLIIMMGGVIVNIIVGFLIYIMVLAVWGETKIDHSKLTKGVAVHPFMEQYGFKTGDQILTVDGEKADELDKLGMEIMLFGKRNFKVKHADGSIQSIQLPEDIGDKMWTNNAEDAFSMRLFMDSLQVIEKGSAAAKLGLKKGDIILSIGDQDLVFYDELKTTLYHSKGQMTTITLKDGDSSIVKKFRVPKDGRLGILPKLNFTTDTNAVYTKDYSLGESFASGFGKGLKTMYGNVAQFKFVFTKKGASSVGGFGSIGKMFPPVWDWRAFWTLTAFISMMLAVMNMLPIPALDGGHVMFLLYEIITGKAPSERFMEIAQYIGFFLLIGLLLYANGNDIIGLFK